ncbi:hypothetical protein FRB97_009144, partial [Tulasnella sp. 331]
MTPVIGQRSLTIAIVPACEDGKILVAIHSVSVGRVRTDYERIAPVHMTSRRVADDSFVGTVISVGRSVPVMSFKAGDAVSGFADGEWVNGSDHNQ